MSKWIVVSGLTLLLLGFAACGAGAEADLDRTPEEVTKRARDMDKAGLEAAIADLEKLAEEIGEETRGMRMEDMSGEKVQELMERGMKIAQRISIYQLELQNR